MMKRKFLAVILPIIGCATVVGSGFSAWYFGSTVTTGGEGSTTIPVQVTDEIRDASGTLSVDTSASTITDKVLILDQGGYKNTREDSGIMFGATGATETTATTTEDDVIVNKWGFTVSYNGQANKEEGIAELTLGQLYDAGLRIRINLSIEIKGDLGKYITFQDSNPTVKVIQSSLAGTADSVKLTRKDKDTIRSADYIITDTQVNGSTLSTASWKFELGVDTKKKEVVGEDPEKKEVDYSNALLKYLPRDYSGNTYNGGKPGAKGEPEKMESDLTNDGEKRSEIVFSVTAFIEDDTDK